MRCRPLLLIPLCFLASASSLLAERELLEVLTDPAVEWSRPADRERAVGRLRQLENTRRQAIQLRARQLGLPIRTIRANGRTEELTDFHPDGRPIYRTTHNFNAAVSTGANLLQSSPYTLNGSGVVVGVWDGGSVRSSHQEFDTRVVLKNSLIAAADHSTHVAGTIAASGVTVSARGMATAATIESYDWTSDISEMTASASATATDGKMRLSNHSYGNITGWAHVDGGTPYRLWQWYGTGTTSTASDTDFGVYNSTSAGQDTIAYNAPYYLIFRSAGNDRGENPANGDAVYIGTSAVTYNNTLHPPGDANYRGGFETISYAALAKNVITVGSVADAVTSGVRDVAKASVSSFTSWGPTDDGRIKPDVVANGEVVNSALSTSDTAYGSYNGTSMATPNACGSAALLVQLYEQLFPGQGMRSSTLKGLLIHTADDLGNPGPDYKTGWGLVNASDAAGLIKSHSLFPLKQRITENVVNASNPTRTVTFVWDGISPIKATLCWTDPVGTSTTSDDRTPRLKNNLNLKIIDPNGGESQPFVMPFVGTWTQASMAEIATTGVNNTDNVEQVRIATPSVSGAYQVQVSYSGSLTNGSQNYSLLITGSSDQAPPPPAAPGNLIASPGNHSASLTWSASVGATGYQVKRALVSGGPFSTIGSVTTPGYVDPTAVNGTTYYYVVSSTNIYGESQDSVEASVTPAPVPSSVTLSSNPISAGPYGASANFSAMVTGPGATGLVTFREGSNVLGTSAIDGSGMAVFQTTSLALGTHLITADFPGDSVYGPSSSNTVSYSINPAPVTIVGVTASEKVYDSTTSATLSGGTVSGVLPGESVIMIPGTGIFDSPDAGQRTASPTGYTIGGPDAANYYLAEQPSASIATIHPLPLQFTGLKTYNASQTVDAADLSITNSLVGANVNLSGTAELAGRTVGIHSVRTSTIASRIQSSSGNTGSNTATFFSVTMSSPPAAGNTLIAIVSTRGTSLGRVTSIVQTGAVWTRAAQSANSGGSTTEIWFAPVSSGASGTIGINQANLRSAAVVIEYSGLLESGALDQAAAMVGSSSSPVTGTTSATTQSNELWIGGIGFSSSTPTLSSPLNGFTSVASTQFTRGQASSNAKVYALEKTITSTTAASSGGALSASSVWSGAIATFRTVSPGSLTLTGPAAGNYTLDGSIAWVQITPKSIGMTATAMDKFYDGTVTATLTGAPSLLEAIPAGSGSPGDAKPYLTDTVTIAGNPSAVFPTRNAGNAMPVAASGFTLSGADAANYTLMQPTGITASIHPRQTTVTAVTCTKVYDGTNAAPGIPEIDPPLVSGDGFALSQEFTDSNAGSGKVIIPSISIFDGNNGENYDITLVNDPTGMITPAAAVVSLFGLQHPYDGFSKPVTVVTSPEGLECEVTYDGAALPPSEPGSYEINAEISDPNYQGSAVSTLVIESNLNLETWVDSHFSEIEQTNGIANENADPDADGFSNLAEYALGTDPHDFDQPLAAEKNENGLSLTFTRPTGLADVVYKAETSENLGSWSPITLEVISEGATETVRAKDPLSGGDPSKRFLRLRFERP